MLAIPTQLLHEAGFADAAALAGAVAEFAAAQAAHARTVDVPAPTAPVLVEEIVLRHDSQFKIDAVPPPAPPPPITVSMRQARIALLRAGKLAAVDDAAKAAGGETEISWDYGTSVCRTDPMVGALAAAIGLSDAEIDALFATAAAT